MVIGSTGTGKTQLARELAVRLIEQGDTVGFVGADMGQPLIGVPTCLGLSMTGTRDQLAALWFIGDVSPRGNLLPAVVGTAKLAQHARRKGARTILVDTTGLVEGAAARALKYHKALAAGVESVVGIERAGELEDMLRLLDGICPTVVRLQPALEATDRNLAERKAYRENKYREYFRDVAMQSFDRSSLIGPGGAWEMNGNRSQLVAGTIVGLLDRDGFCLGLGLIEEAESDRLTIFTSCKHPAAVVRLQLGKVRLNRRDGFTEVP
jgi:polynucleotide 5'-hydroxyl-kinase GRC3/NOL9